MLKLAFELSRIFDTLLAYPVDNLRRVFKLILAIWRSQPMRKQLRERQPITARLRSNNLEPRLSGIR